ncbi:hypothetical protein [Acidisoma sp. 7E03]
MTNTLEDALSGVSSFDHDSGGDVWWALLGSGLHGTPPMENATLTALLLLLVAAAERRQALPATGRIVNLVCALRETSEDATVRASVVSRLSEALACLRGTLN